MNAMKAVKAERWLLFWFAIAWAAILLATWRAEAKDCICHRVVARCGTDDAFDEGSNCVMYGSNSPLVTLTFASWNTTQTEVTVLENTASGVWSGYAEGFDPAYVGVWWFPTGYFDGYLEEPAGFEVHFEETNGVTYTVDMAATNCKAGTALRYVGAKGTFTLTWKALQDNNPCPCQPDLRSDENVCTLFHDSGIWVTLIHTGATNYAGYRIGCEAPNHWISYPVGNLEAMMQHTGGIYQLRAAVYGIWTTAWQTIFCTQNFAAWIDGYGAWQLEWNGTGVDCCAQCATAQPFCVVKIENTGTFCIDGIWTNTFYGYNDTGTIDGTNPLCEWQWTESFLNVDGVAYLKGQSGKTNHSVLLAVNQYGCSGDTGKVMTNNEAELECNGTWGGGGRLKGVAVFYGIVHTNPPYQYWPGIATNKYTVYFGGAS